MARLLIASVNRLCRSRNVRDSDWHTHQDNAVARKLYDKVARFRALHRFVLREMTVRMIDDARFAFPNIAPPYVELVIPSKSEEVTYLGPDLAKLHRFGLCSPVAQFVM